MVWVIVALMLITCASENVHPSQDENPMTEKKLAEVLKDRSGELMLLPGVVGAALGRCDDAPCIKVYVVESTPELDRKILDRLTGYPVQIEATGPLQALPEDQP